MNVPQATVQLFRKALLLWVVVYTVSAWVGAEAVAGMLSSPAFLPTGPLTDVTHTLLFFPGEWLGLLAPILAYGLIALCIHDLFRGSRWWSAALIWWAYVNLMHIAWLAGSGGQQLISNLLFWSILLALPANASASPFRFAAFWIIRLQLLLAYFATGLHKLQGTHWLDGSAMGIVASDSAFGPLWILDFPLLAKGLTLAVLAFQLSFPLAVWWRATRIPWMCFGIVFHLGTALWMDLPDMALAFILTYTLWLAPEDVQRLRSLVPVRSRGGVDRE